MVNNLRQNTLNRNYLKLVCQGIVLLVISWSKQKINKWSFFMRGKQTFCFIHILWIREAIKKRLSFGHCPKGGGGSTGIQKFGGSFVFP